MKICYKCKTKKESNDYHKDSSRKDGLSNICKLCKILSVDKWQKKNKDKTRAKCNRWNAKHRETENKRKNRWKKENKDKVKVLKSRYRASKVGATGSHSAEEWRKLKEICNFTCLCCGKKEPEIILTEDHIIPLSVGGSNFIENIQPLCKTCNSIKYIKIIKYITV